MIPFLASCPGYRAEDLYFQSRQEKEKSPKNVQFLDSLASYFHSYVLSCSAQCPCHMVWHLSENRQLLSYPCKGMWGMILWLQAWGRGPGMFQMPVYSLPTNLSFQSLSASLCWYLVPPGVKLIKGFQANCLIFFIVYLQPPGLLLYPSKSLIPLVLSIIQIFIKIFCLYYLLFCVICSVGW